MGWTGSGAGVHMQGGGRRSAPTTGVPTITDGADAQRRKGVIRRRGRPSSGCEGELRDDGVRARTLASALLARCRRVPKADRMAAAVLVL